MAPAGENSDNGIFSPWDVHASLYDEVQGEEGDAAHRLIYDPQILELLGDVAGKRVLDAGCGNGCWSRRLAAQATTVVGVDSSAELIKIAAAKENPGNVRYQHCDLAERLELESESFDLVLCSMVFHYMPLIGTAVAEFSRLLADGGEAVICIQHPIYQYHYRAQALAGKITAVFPETISYFSHAPIDQVTLFGKVRLATYNRTLEDYVRVFAENAFALTSLREPQFTDELLNVMPRYREVSEVPRVAVLRFRRTG